MLLAVRVVWRAPLGDLGDFTNKSTSEGLALSFGRRPSILGRCR